VEENQRSREGLRKTRRWKERTSGMGEVNSVGCVQEGEQGDGNGSGPAARLNWPPLVQGSELVPLTEVRGQWQEWPLLLLSVRGLGYSARETNEANSDTSLYRLDVLLLYSCHLHSEETIWGPWVGRLNTILLINTEPYDWRVLFIVGI